MFLKDIKLLFLQELSNIYTTSECTELFFIFSEKLLNFNKFALRLNPEKAISPQQEKEILLTISELKTGKPYQQVLGEVEFYGNTFFINENVLIPRPETEELIEICINKLKDKKNHPFKILDIGTGSGCISISLAKYFLNAEITSIDISKKALEVAQQNAHIHKVKINFIQKDYLNENLDNAYDIIISNPPYIDISEKSEISISVKDFEPNIALFAPKNNTLAFYKKIAEDLQKHLKEKGLIFLEINQKLGLETLNLFQKKLSHCSLIKDLSQNDRFIIGEK